MGIHVISDSTGEPSNWKLEHFANIGGSEEFVQQLVEELTELVDASMIVEPERQLVKDAVLAVSFEGVMPAFERLKQIRASAGQRMPELNRKQLYEAFTIELARAYKDLMQRAAKLLEPEIGFLFQNDAKFETGLLAWDKKRPGILQAVGPYFRRQRGSWQNDLIGFRNYLEHKNETDAALYAGRYDPVQAEALFESVWRTIADIMAMLISFHLGPGVRLFEIPPAERSLVRPRRFRFHIEGFSPAQDR